MAIRAGTLTFSDDFNRGDILNPDSDTTWNNTFPGGGRTLPQFGEKQVFLNDGQTTLGGALFNIDPIRIANGTLTLEAKPLPSNLIGPAGGYTHSSGMVNTSGGPFEFRYGYVEMRAQIPSGGGLLPAFYMVRSDKSFIGEIDIFEILGKDPSFVYSTLHYSKDGTTSTKEMVARRDMPVDLSKGYHTYGVDWQPNRITFYVDGVAIGDTATPDALKAPMSIIAHLAVGGTWPGAPVASSFPAQFNIDYIKVWQTADAMTPVSLSGTAAANTLSGGDGNDVLRGLDGNDTLLGSRGDDNLQGGNGADRLLGGPGRDTLDGGGGPDSLEGGRGDDTYIINDAGDVIIDFQGAGFDTVQTSLAKYSISGTMEGLVYTGSGGFTGGGNANANVIHGGSGKDKLMGGDGADSLYGHLGNDSINGGVGNDVLVGGGGNDTLAGDAGADTYVVSGQGTTRIVGFQHGIDKLDVRGFGLTSFAQVQAHDSVSKQGDLVIASNGETLILQGIKPAGIDAGDFVFSGATNGGGGNPSPAPSPSPAPAPAPAPSPAPSGDGKVISGTGGADVLTSTSSHDTLVGKAGNDTYVIDHRGAAIVEQAGQGVDEVKTALGSFTLTGHLEELTFTGKNAFEGVGNGLANTLSGGNGADHLMGGAGGDLLQGGGGNDSIYGGVGADRIEAGLGHDTVAGAEGADIFIFASASGASTTLVRDFAQGQDRLDVGALGLSSLADVLSHAHNNPDGHVEIVAAGQTIELQGVKEAALKAGDFIF